MKEFNYPFLSEEEFEIKLVNLLAETNIQLKEKDRPFLHTTINKLLTLLQEVKVGKLRLDYSLLFEDFDLFITQEKEFKGIQYGQERYLLYHTIEDYFSNPRKEVNGMKMP